MNRPYKIALNARLCTAGAAGKNRRSRVAAAAAGEKTQKYEKFRPKRKKVSEFIKSIENGTWQEIKVPYGTKERSGFVFGLNKEHKDGRIFQYAVDFNGEKKLVKII